MSASSRDTNHLNRQAWESAEFPIVCETCLGPNPYVRMTKEAFGSACKVCERPFTVFRWQPGKGSRFKKTELCQTCAKIKNVCQTCVLDLEYGVPVQLRDRLLGQEQALPESAVNKEYYIQNQEAKFAQIEGHNAFNQSSALAITGGGDAAGGPAGGKLAAGRAILERLKARGPYYKRNEARICSFWVKGQCTRGDTCPFRHEMPTDPKNPLAKQNLMGRYHGTEDPVAEKYLKKIQSRPKAEAPADTSITTLYIGGVRPDLNITADDLRDYFEKHSQVAAVRLAPKQSAAFVEFATREGAEQAMEIAAVNCIIKGEPLRVMWGKARSNNNSGGRGGAAPSVAVPALPGFGLPPGFGMAPPPGAPGAGALPPGLGLAPPPGMVGGRPGMAYPSMDPSRMGAKAPAKAPTS
ncbi:uncharacterized protein MONBRDRAFT_32985 [Monosiga brevicollis MX1]|uniref:Pre-mRNA-splicing factor RBM22 n=1 Tax=Monosiga brevicollis TaxID=81824 RepID=A9V2W1_MONBE|nr:uncharacterized protein MONBRDRAFT_32985 [Monosiga brevicollis MX1]EDQ88082.1 predicted protein [Monosiga brevicollis MX1]|eukprot:XP_001747158.1 hypothetical protein [Monosiga brevicollis MX1]